MKKPNSPHLGLCECYFPLWTRISDDTVTIMGSGGQEYKICYKWLKVTCPNCQKPIAIFTSEAPSPDNIFDLNDQQSKIVESKLSSAAKKILPLFRQNNGDYKETKAASGLKENIFKKHWDSIIAEIQNVKALYDPLNTDNLYHQKRKY